MIRNRFEQLIPSVSVSGPGHWSLCHPGSLPLCPALLLHLRPSDQPRVPRPERVCPGPRSGLRRQELHVRGLRRGSRLLQLLQVSDNFLMYHDFKINFSRCVGCSFVSFTCFDDVNCYW